MVGTIPKDSEKKSAWLFSIVTIFIKSRGFITASSIVCAITKGQRDLVILKISVYITLQDITTTKPIRNNGILPTGRASLTSVSDRKNIMYGRCQIHHMHPTST